MSSSTCALNSSWSMYYIFSQINFLSVSCTWNAALKKDKVPVQAVWTLESGNTNELQYLDFPHYRVIKIATLHLITMLSPPSIIPRCVSIFLSTPQIYKHKWEKVVAIDEYVGTEDYVTGNSYVRNSTLQQVNQGNVYVSTLIKLFPTLRLIIQQHALYKAFLDSLLPIFLPLLWAIAFPYNTALLSKSGTSGHGK